SAVCAEAYCPGGDAVARCAPKAPASAIRTAATTPLDIRIADDFRLSSGMGDRARAGRADLLGILAQHPGLVRIGRRLPGLAPPHQLRLGHLQVERALLRIDGDDVAVLHQRDRSARRRLRPHMADAEAAGAAREAPVGDERHLVAHALAVEAGRGRQHLTHARAALGALVADDENLAFLVLAVLHRAEAVLLAVEHASRTAELQLGKACDLDDGAVRCQRALQADDAAGGR